MAAATEERKAETHDMIIHAARKVFSEKGFHKAQISDIVREAGISTGSIYAHFRDKRDLFEQVSRENLQALRKQLQDLRMTTLPDDFAGRVETWKLTYSAFFDFVDRHPQELLMIVRGGFGVDEDHDQSLWAFFNAFAQDMARDFQKWMDLGFLQGLNPFLMGQITVGMCMQTAHSYIEDRQFSRREAINTLMALNGAMFSIYLTDKGRKELGDMSVPQLPDDED